MVTASDRIFNLLTSNDELIGSLDWMSDDAWSRHPSADEWSVAEIIGHVIELEVYWAQQAARLAETPGCELGRSLEDPGRLAGPKSGLDLSAREARLRLAQAGEQAAGILRKIPDAAWSTKGKAGSGETTVGEIVRQRLVEHVRVHLEQATAALAAVPSND